MQGVVGAVYGVLRVYADTVSGRIMHKTLKYSFCYSFCIKNHGVNTFESE